MTYQSDVASTGREHRPAYALGRAAEYVGGARTQPHHPSLSSHHLYQMRVSRL